MEDLIKALLIFLKYGNKQYPTSCEHDILYVDIDPSVVPDEDKKTLDELVFFVDDENDCFASFKYGSM
jgi:hypothetical protein